MAGFSSDLALGVMVDELDAVGARRVRIDAVWAQLAIDYPGVKIRMTIPGIDYYLVLIIAYEVGEPSRVRLDAVIRWAEPRPRP